MHGRIITLTNSTVSGNDTTGDYATGGGIYGNETTIADSTISENRAFGSRAEGGGVFSEQVTTVTNSTVYNNIAIADGGGIHSGFTTTVTNSTLSGNSSTAAGGGIYSGGTTTLTNTTISDNFSSVEGVGIAVSGQLTLTNSVVLGNFSFQTANEEIFRAAPGGGGGTPAFEGLNIVGADGRPSMRRSVRMSQMPIPRRYSRRPRTTTECSRGCFPTMAGRSRRLRSGTIRQPALDASTGANIPAEDARGVAAFDQPGVGAEGAGNPGIRDLGAFELAPADTTPPDAPLILAIAEDTGADPADGITSDQQLIVSGTAEASATVLVLINGVEAGNTQADATTGAFAFGPTDTLIEGSYDITARAIGRGGQHLPGQRGLLGRDRHHTHRTRPACRT